MKKALRILFAVLTIASTAYVATGGNALAGGKPACFYNGYDEDPICVY